MSSGTQWRMCVACGSINDLVAEKCWLCHKRLKPPKPGASPFKPGAVLQDSHKAAELSSLVASILLPGLVVLVCLGVFLQSRGLGIVLAILAAPGLIRVWIDSAKRWSKGQPMSGGQQVSAFVKTTFLTVGSIIAIISLACIAVVIAFFAICGSMLINNP